MEKESQKSRCNSPKYNIGNGTKSKEEQKKQMMFAFLKGMKQPSGHRVFRSLDEIQKEYFPDYEIVLVTKEEAKMIRNLRKLKFKHGWTHSWKYRKGDTNKSIRF